MDRSGFDDSRFITGGLQKTETHPINAPIFSNVRECTLLTFPFRGKECLSSGSFSKGAMHVKLALKREEV